jgi:hypothetical protein
VGWIGTLLPIVLLVGDAISSTAPRLYSISGYDYTRHAQRLRRRSVRHGLRNLIALTGSWRGPEAGMNAVPPPACGERDGPRYGGRPELVGTVGCCARPLDVVETGDLVSGVLVIGLAVPAPVARLSIMNTSAQWLIPAVCAIADH